MEFESKLHLRLTPKNIKKKKKMNKKSVKDEVKVLVFVSFCRPSALMLAFFCSEHRLRSMHGLNWAEHFHKKKKKKKHFLFDIFFCFVFSQNKSFKLYPFQKLSQNACSKS